jgi:iron complex transport system permease protein
VLLTESRIPRTVALLLAGAGLAVSGQIMQMLSRNRFVEPATAGTSESAALGLLAVTLVDPSLSPLVRMAVAAVFAMAGTAVFLLLLRAVPLRSPYIVPLIGLMLGGVIGALTTFLAYRADLMQSLSTWVMGDFSAILSGRYELLWGAGGLTLVAYWYADRFTLAGMGEAFALNLGLSYRQVMTLGLTVIALVTAAVVVTCGMIPFVGLIVPNLVSMVLGDRARATLPWVALCGAALVLACDIAGRLLVRPYEMPVGTTMGVLGGIVFLLVLVRSGGPRHG